MAIKAIQANNGSVNINSKTEVGVDQINNLIQEAEQRWAIMMHHDAITGTHTKITERDYYNMLKESNDYLTKAYNMVNQNFGLKANKTVVDHLKKITEDLKSSKYDHYTVVNPTANVRSEVLNMTLTASSGENDTYAVFMHYANGTFRSKVFENNI